MAYAWKPLVQIRSLYRFRLLATLEFLRILSLVKDTTGNLRSTELAHAVVFVLYIVTDLLPLNAKLHNTSIQLIQRRRLYVGVVFSEKISNKAAGRSCRFPSPP